MRKAREIAKSADGKRIICVDVENSAQIMGYIGQSKRHKDKFKYIANIILEGYRNTEVYDKENINGKSKGVTAMKFFKNGDNDRLYCKEIKQGDKILIIVASELFEKKKTNKNDKRIVSIINKVAGYEYEIIKKEE